MMMQEQIREEAGGAMLFDASLASGVDNDWFDPGYWRARDALEVQGGGRGGVAMIDTPAGACVLRHYHRGGLVARFNRDRYLWTGAAHTRSFAEFRLLAHIAALELPAPQPVAARLRRHGLFYTGDLITRRIDGAHTLAQCLADGRLDADLARETGALVARFHREGIWHADLNAHNAATTKNISALSKITVRANATVNGIARNTIAVTYGSTPIRRANQNSTAAVASVNRYAGSRAASSVGPRTSMSAPSAAK